LRFFFVFLTFLNAYSEVIMSCETLFGVIKDEKYSKEFKAACVLKKQLENEELFPYGRCWKLSCNKKCLPCKHCKQCSNCCKPAVCGDFSKILSVVKVCLMCGASKNPKDKKCGDYCNKFGCICSKCICVSCEKCKKISIVLCGDCKSCDKCCVCDDECDDIHPKCDDIRMPTFSVPCCKVCCEKYKDRCEKCECCRECCPKCSDCGKCKASCPGHCPKCKEIKCICKECSECDNKYHRNGCNMCSKCEGCCIKLFGMCSQCGLCKKCCHPIEGYCTTFIKEVYIY